jgi:dipeptidyl aminopeptidase/acylaminoacyl peptidase
MKTTIIFIQCFLLWGINVIAQQEITVRTFNYHGPVSVQKPVVLDSTDVNDKTYSSKNLLQTSVDIRFTQENGQTVQTDSSGFIILPQDSLHNALHFLQFKLDADRYASVRLEIQGTGLFDVFVDKKKEGSNTHAAKDTSDIEPVYINLNVEPRQYQITVKYLTEAGKQDTLQLKCLVHAKDSLTRYTVLSEGKRRLTLPDIVEGVKLTNTSISPSGKYYFASYSHFYSTGKRYAYHELRERKNDRLIHRFSSSENIFWMPSSDYLCFWRSGETDKSLIRFCPESLQEDILVEALSVESSVIAPNEQFMIVLKKDTAPGVSGALKKLLEPDDRMDGFRNRYSLYKYDFARQSLERITFGRTNTSLSDISPDSKKILFYTSSRHLQERPFYKRSFFLMDLDNVQIDTLLIDDKYVSNGSFSPDGKQILFSGTPEAFDKAGENILSGISNGYDIQGFIMDLSTRKIKTFTRNFNPSISSMQWSEWDRQIYLRTVDEDREQVYRYHPQTDLFERLPLQEDVVYKFSIARQSGCAMYYGQSVSNSSRLYSFDLKSQKSKLIAAPAAKAFSDIQLGEVRDFNFVSNENKDTIKGRYYLPPNFDPTRHYPLIVYYYGGTTPTARLFESRYPLHVYAALGYVVYTLQPSGTIGFGQTFSARHVNAWGLQTAEDIIEGTRKFCKSHPFIDESKIGCMGASYGGFMTQYLLTKTDLFAAAASHAGISNIASYWGEGYWGYSYSGVASADSYPWNNAELYVNQSPLFHADKINTPLLLLHGNSDTNVPVGESIQMFNALKILGKTVEFIQIEGENHAIMDYDKRLKWNKSIFAWFAKWLKGEPEWWESLP